MARRARHPLKSCVLFALVAVAGYMLWTHRDKIRLEREVDKIDPAMVERIEEALVERFEDDDCWDGMRAGLLYRGHENRFRLEIDIHSGCGGEGRELCEQVAAFVRERSGGRAVSVWGFTGGSVVSRAVL